MYTYTHKLHVDIYLYIPTYIYNYTSHIHIKTYIYMHTYTHVYTCTHICACIHETIHMYTYIILIHTCKCIYIYIHSRRKVEKENGHRTGRRLEKDTELVLLLRGSP